CRRRQAWRDRSASTHSSLGLRRQRESRRGKRGKQSSAITFVERAQGRAEGSPSGVIHLRRPDRLERGQEGELEDYVDKCLEAILVFLGHVRLQQRRNESRKCLTDATKHHVA